MVQSGGSVSILGVPEGSGQRMGVDRNMNGAPDGNETTGQVLESFLALGSGMGLEPGPTVFGFTLWVDPAASFFVIASFAADDLGFGYLPLPLPSSLSYENLEFSAMAITLNTCAPELFAGSQGVRFELAAP